MRALLLLTLVILGCRPMQPVGQRVDNLPPIRVQDAEVITGIDTSGVEIVSWLNPAVIRARVDVSDVLRPVFGGFGQGDPARVRISVSFSTYSDLAGEIVPVRFDAAGSTVYVTYDAPAPPVTLAFRGRSYVAEMPRGSARFAGPNYYMVHLRAGGREYAVARVPVVQPLTILAPPPDNPQFGDEDVNVTFRSESWPVLWSNADRAFQFQHDNIAVVTEREAGGTLRLISQRTAPGSTTTEPVSLVLPPMVSPYPAEGNSGAIYVITRYRSTPYTEGPTDFMLEEWTSSAGAQVSIRWML